MAAIKLLSIEESRELDQKTIEGGFVSGEELMRRAGKAISSFIVSFCNERNLSREILLLAGKGNNGGDAFVTAFYLAQSGFTPKVLLTVPVDSLKEDALVHFNKMVQSQVPIAVLAKPGDLKSVLGQFRGDVLVDGLLGSGFKPPLSDFYSELIKQVNQSDFYVLAIDIPSGMGEDIPVENPCIQADITLTIGSVKDVMIAPANVNYVGRLYTLDIGFPRQVLNEFPSRIHIFHEMDCKFLLSRRRRNDHKGTFGHVLSIGGSLGTVGALILSGLGSLRSGAGLLSLYPEKEVRLAVHGKLTEAMTVNFDALLEKFVAGKPREIGDALQKFDALCLGPGLGVSRRSGHLMKAVLKSFKGPIVIDADGLNLLASGEIVLPKPARNIILTPHPGEAGRLLGLSPQEIEEGRLEAVKKLWDKFRATIVLKGANTLVGDASAPTLHLTGTPAMAQGGMGDVLSGIIAGFAAQGMTPLAAANLSVCLHGMSAEDLENRKGPFGFSASEVADNLPLIVKKFGRISRKTEF